MNIAEANKVADKLVEKIEFSLSIGQLDSAQKVADVLETLMRAIEIGVGLRHTSTN